MLQSFVAYARASHHSTETVRSNVLELPHFREMTRCWVQDGADVRVLLGLAGELSTFTDGRKRPPVFPPYRHDDLGGTLGSMGLTAPFGPDADFSGIAPSLFVSQAA